MEFHDILKLYLKSKINLEVIKELKSGKDADLFLVRDVTDVDEQKSLVLKVYKTIADVTLNRFNPYLVGRTFTGNYSKVIESSSKRGKKFLADLRVKREFNQLKKLNKYTHYIPKPIKTIENTILMEFIGDNDIPAKRLDELNLSKQQAQTVLAQLVEFITQMTSIDLVHGDLSPFNILYHQDKICVIDFPQTVDLTTNPDWIKFYDRDTENVLKYFRNLLEASEIDKAREQLEKLKESVVERLVYNL
jgi:RIO kinase 1